MCAQGVLAPRPHRPDPAQLDKRLAAPASTTRESRGHRSAVLIPATPVVVAAAPILTVAVAIAPTTTVAAVAAVATVASRLELPP